MKYLLRTNILAAASSVASARRPVMLRAAGLMALIATVFLLGFTTENARTTIDFLSPNGASNSNEAFSPPPMTDQSVTFNYTGTVQNWIVPAGVTAVTLQLRGADGGDSSQKKGGSGGNVRATFSVGAGQTLSIIVGGAGAYNTEVGGGGGGTAVGNSGTIMAVAGGGGGGNYGPGRGDGWGAQTSASQTGNAGGSGFGGGGGGINGAAGSSPSGAGGGGQASLSSFSAGGVCGGTISGQNFPGGGGFGGGGGGSVIFGNFGGSWENYGFGGGGGGYTGGGGGGAGGLGGFNFVAAGATGVTNTGGTNGGGLQRNGEVIISYTTCPSFSGAPANVSITNSTCSTGCTIAGGSISAPSGSPCPALSTLQYQVNGGSWTTVLPTYNQTGPAQTIRTRCACNNDPGTVSPVSNPVTTNPGTLTNPVVPANGTATVACPTLAVPPTLPAVTGCDGSAITPAGPSITDVPSSLTCEGTRTYTYTYSCGGTSSVWSFIYTIERQPFTVPANGAGVANNAASATPPAPPVVMSHCGEILIPVGPTVTDNPDPIVCTGTRTYTWTYTDCEGNTAIWSFVYNVLDTEPPVVSCTDQTIVFNGEQIIPLNIDDLVTARDNCAVQSIVLNPPAITCQQLGQTVPVLATITDVYNNVATCVSNITVAGLPCGWNQNPDGVGCSDGNNIAYNPGTGIWTATSTGCYYASPFTSDEAGFAQRTLCGNGSITARVMSMDDNGWAGIVMRESNAPGAKKAQLMTNLSSFSRREFRTVTNGSAIPQQFPSLNRYWLRIVRTGNQFAMYVSPNGTAWYFAGTQNIAMNNCIQMGLTATNYLQNGSVTATFSHVSFTGSISPVAGSIGQRAESLRRSSTGAKEGSIEQPYSFEVYPNPTVGALNVDLTQYIGRSVRIETYSLEGKILQFSEIDEVQTMVEQLNLSAFPSGTYLVKVKSAGLPDSVRRVVLNRN